MGSISPHAPAPLSMTLLNACHLRTGHPVHCRKTACLAAASPPSAIAAVRSNSNRFRQERAPSPRDTQENDPCRPWIAMYLEELRLVSGLPNCSYRQLPPLRDQSSDSTGNNSCQCNDRASAQPHLHLCEKSTSFLKCATRLVLTKCSAAGSGLSMHAESGFGSWAMDTAPDTRIAS